MEFVEHFGINWILIVAQIVNFLVILYILKRFLYKPLFAVFKKREDLIKDSIKNAEAAEAAKEKAYKEEKVIIKKANETANLILKDARDEAAKIQLKAEEAAKKRTDRMINDAKIQIEQDTKAAEDKLTKKISDLAVGILRKSLTNVFTEKEQEEIVKRAITAMKK